MDPGQLRKMIRNEPGVKADNDPTKPAPEGFIRIGAAIQDKSSPGMNDWHFYRQLPDGSWLHKRGSGPVENVDASGKPIIDPQKANRNYPGCNYDTWVGTMLVPDKPKRP